MQKSERCEFLWHVSLYVQLLQRQIPDADKHPVRASETITHTCQECNKLNVESRKQVPQTQL